jgi:membrane-bound lytic murein transglycosylase F
MAPRATGLVGGCSLLLLSLAGCSQPDDRAFETPPVVADTQAAVRDFEAIQRAGRVRLLMARRPAGNTSTTGRVLPLPGTPLHEQLQAAVRFARSLNLEPVIVPVARFKELVPALRAGRGDVIVANQPITARRRDRMAFTAALDRSARALVARRDDPIDEPADLAGRRLTVGFESPFWETVKRLQDRFVGLEVATRPNLSTRHKLDLLAAGEIDLTLIERNKLDSELQYRDDIHGVFAVSPETGMGWGVRSDAEQLRSALNRFISQRKLAESGAEQHTQDLAAIEASGTLRVATRNNPSSYFVWRGQLLGFQYELARRFADHLGLRLEIVVADPNDSLEAMVRSGRADIAAAFLEGDPDENSEGIAWSRPYHYAIPRVITGDHGTDFTTPADLAEHTFHVRPDSTAWRTLERLRREQDIDFTITPVPDGQRTRTVLRQVATGAYDLTLVDEHIVKNAPAWQADVRTALKLGERDAHRWAVRAASPELLAAVNDFFDRTYRGTFYNVLHAKYFEDRDRIRQYRAQRVAHDGVQGLSPFDPLIKRYAERHGFDWRLIASQIFQESGFNPEAKSWVGASGLMQILPRTAEQIGVDGDLTDPEANIRAGVQYLDWLRARFEADLSVRDRMWFTLAAFNAGTGHVRDARRLAESLGLDPDRWFDHVEKAMLKLSQPRYFRDAKFGYVRGQEPVEYVRRIRERYQAYILWTNDCWPSCRPSSHPTVAGTSDDGTRAARSARPGISPEGG